MKFLILLILISTIPLSSASSYKLKQKDCTDIDIRDKHPHLREHFSTPADQGSIGWCYGYSAADLLTVEAGVPLSPSHVSSVYNSSIRSNFFWKAAYDIRTLFSGRETYEGGFIGKALREAMKANPVCEHNKIDEYTHLIGMLEVAKLRIKNKEISHEAMCAIIQHSLPNINIDTENFMSDFISKNINDTLESMLRQNCQTVNIPQKETKVLYKPLLWGKKKYVDKVNDLLTSGKPLGVSYNVNHISEKLSGYHASTVIGRRWNNGRCEYNIRNTWGRLCEYKPGIECNQDDGSYWVKDEDFYKLALNFTYLE